MRRTVMLTFVSDWLPKLVNFVAILLLARRLGAPSFAYWAVALAWIGYAWWAVDLGQAGYSIRTLASTDDSQQRRIGSEIFSLYLALALTVTLGLAAVLTALGSFHSPHGRLLLAMSPYLVSYAVFPDWWLRARGLLMQLGVANWAAAVALLTGVILLPARDGVGFALCYALAPLAGAAVALLVLAHRHFLPRLTLSPRAWIRHLRISLKFSAAGLGGQVAVPVALATMAGRSSATAAAAFALGLRAAGAAANALWLLLHNALPRLLHGHNKVTPRAILLAAVPPLIAVGVAALLWEPLILPLVGPSYAGVGGSAALGLMLLAVWGPKYMVEIGLIAAFRDSARIVMNLVPAIVVVAAAASGAAEGRTWVMPVALLAGESAAALLGGTLLTQRGVARVDAPVAAQVVTPDSAVIEV